MSPRPDLKVNVATVNRWEKGRTFPSYSAQAKLEILEEAIKQGTLPSYRIPLDRPGGPPPQLRGYRKRRDVKKAIEDFLNDQKVPPQQQKEPALEDQPKPNTFDI
jgi:transcriptional regulator with XRE-family HTH domain